MENDQIRDTILANIDRAAQAWNGGDMDRYLDYYRHDENLSIYMSGGQLIGSKAVNAFYRGTWSNPEAMGNFDSSDSVVNVLSPTIAVLHGKFRHRFPDKTVIGNYSMVWQCQADAWKIVHEHTARDQVIQHD